jgi:hypothetical protein
MFANKSDDWHDGMAAGLLIGIAIGGGIAVVMIGLFC